MKELIAVGTKDGTIVNEDHFGQSKIFVIFRKNESGFKEVEKRPNPYFGKHQHAKAEEILKVLGDCNVWIAKSMGKKSIETLKALNYETFLTVKDTAEDAIKDYLEIKKGSGSLH